MYPGVTASAWRMAPCMCRGTAWAHLYDHTEVLHGHGRAKTEGLSLLRCSTFPVPIFFFPLIRFVRGDD